MKKIDAFEGLLIVKDKIKKLIPVKTIELSFSIDEEGRENISLTVFHRLEGKDTNNFSINEYGFDSGLSLEELIARCKAKIATINPTQVTKFVLNQDNK